MVCVIQQWEENQDKRQRLGKEKKKKKQLQLSLTFAGQRESCCISLYPCVLPPIHRNIILNPPLLDELLINKIQKTPDWEVD